VCSPCNSISANHRGTVFGLWGMGDHAENQNTWSATAQSHSGCGNACGPDASSCVCSGHPLDESSALQAAYPKRIPGRNASRPSSIIK
jgi:hypothetical protein